MFRDDAQRARACRALLAIVRLEQLWSHIEPLPEAMDLLAHNGGPLSSGERIFLLAAFAFWNGVGDLRLAEVIEELGGDHAEAICSLVVACARGASAVDIWLATYERPPRLTAIDGNGDR
jgi:hypothetical protein